MIRITFNDGRTYITETSEDGVVEYRTDRTGHGLWAWVPMRAEWQQQIGSGQICLAGSRSTIRARFERLGRDR